jgi:hypothetical protein
MEFNLQRVSGPLQRCERTIHVVDKAAICLEYKNFLFAADWCERTSGRLLTVRIGREIGYMNFFVGQAAGPLFPVIYR